MLNCWCGLLCSCAGSRARIACDCNLPADTFYMTAYLTASTCFENASTLAFPP